MPDNADQLGAQIDVEVQFWGPFREFSAKASEFFTLPAGTTIGDLMDILYATFGPALKNLIIEETTGQFWSLMAIALNGRIISDVKALNIRLCNGDKLLLLPPALGG